MSILTERQNAFEKKFALSEENEFKVRIRASKSFGLWAAEKMNLSEEKKVIYIKNLVDAVITNKASNFLIEYIQKDLLGVGQKLSKNDLEGIFQDHLKTNKASLGQNR
jgi:hypothetical protein